MTLNLGYIISLTITVALLLLVLIIQLKESKFHAPVYWLVIVGTTTVGTEVSDLMDRTLGLGYTIGSIILLSCLLLVLFLWHRKEGKIRVYPVTEVRIETFYWIAILFSNSLGTSFGDYLSDVIGLSYLAGAAITAGIILIVLLLHYYTKINRVLLFWIAFIFTRPFGATFGDLMTKPASKGGLHFSRGIAAIIAAALLSAVLFYSTRTETRDKSNNQNTIET
jgi:uncharacterized membrane-anchored protein